MSCHWCRRLMKTCCIYWWGFIVTTELQRICSFRCMLNWLLLVSKSGKNHSKDHRTCSSFEYQLLISQQFWRNCAHFWQSFPLHPSIAAQILDAETLTDHEPIPAPLNHIHVTLAQSIHRPENPKTKHPIKQCIYRKNVLRQKMFWLILKPINGWGKDGSYEVGCGRKEKIHNVLLMKKLKGFAARLLFSSKSRLQKIYLL